MAKGDWIEVPVTIVLRGLRRLRYGDYSTLEFAYLCAFGALIIWLFFIRSKLLGLADQREDALVRYSFGACLLGLTTMFVLLCFLVGAA